MNRKCSEFEEKVINIDEKSASLQALNRGLLAAFKVVCERLTSYNSFLAEEIEEGTVGEEYLEQSTKLLAHAADWCSEEPDGDDSQSKSREILHLAPLLEGAAERCARVVPEKKIELQKLDEELVFQCEFFRLQELLVQLLIRFSREICPKNETFRVLAENLVLDEATTGLLAPGTTPGHHVLIGLTTASDAEFNASTLRFFWDAVLEDTDTLAPNQQLLKIHGTILDLGGNLYFSAAGKPQTLWLLLPGKSASSKMQAISNIEDPSLRGTETILLVDDEDMIWDVIIDMLQELNYQVILAGDGVDAVEIYRENPGCIDLVLLDMVMPRLDGHGAFQKIREIDPEARVLLSSGHVRQEDVQDILNAGAAGFLRKPYRMIDLARKVRGILDLPNG